MRTLFINLTRFGDLLQTQPAITGITNKGGEVGLVCLDNFAGAAALLRHVRQAHAMPGARFLASLDKSWGQSLSVCLEWARGVIHEHRPEVIVNLTPMLSSRMLSRLFVQASDTLGLPEPELHGFGLDPFGFGSSSNPWTVFLQASSGNRGCSPFNLVDLFCKSVGLDKGPWAFSLQEPDSGAMGAALELLGALPKGMRGFVALQLGASADRRRWPVERFAALGGMLAKELRLMPVLLGSKGEAQLGERYLQAGAPAVNRIGKTSLPELAAVLRQSELLVSNDTGTMHLAAGLGVPLAAIFLATAQPWDTGPYAVGNYCLEPDLDCHPCQFGTECPHDLRCRLTIPPETVLEVVAALAGKELEGASLTGARVWRTRLDDQGYMDLAGCSGHELRNRTQWVRLQRHVYRSFFNGADLSKARVVEPRVVLGADFQEQARQVLGVMRQLLTLMEGQVRALSVAPHDMMKQKFLATWQRVQALLSQSSHFNVLSHIYALDSQEAGHDLPALGKFLKQYQELTDYWLRNLS